MRLFWGAMRFFWGLFRGCLRNCFGDCSAGAVGLFWGCSGVALGLFWGALGLPWAAQPSGCVCVQGALGTPRSRCSGPPLSETWSFLIKHQQEECQLFVFIEDI